MLTHDPVEDGRALKVQRERGCILSQEGTFFEGEMAGRFELISSNAVK